MLVNRIVNKNLKDSEGKPSASYREGSINVSVIPSYTKINKLITALYMVTDILDKDEPLKGKLRTLGTDIISDMHVAPVNALGKIYQIMSFLDIASAINIISEMNTSILRKEFLALDQSIKESNNQVETSSFQIDKQINLSEFFRVEIPLPKVSSNRQHLGVQKGSTLMKALSRFHVSDKNNVSNRKSPSEFETLKRQRREEIISIIASSPNGATITDIKSKATGSLVSCGEKTLQRELVSMVKDNVLNKIGEKRWSRYFIKN